MEVKEAVKIAIDYIVEVFSEDNLSNIGLEEITFSEPDDTWHVTIGFSRPWDYQSQTLINPLIDKLQQRQPVRQFKVVKVDNQTGKVREITIRE
uniref:Uncharacterized protein n=1 Tax=Candidatus Kentrum eta TaxID=2126337 RepID=A0A450UWM9_9GAMM|nr:MAG: hypothetical protein BECKH772A_GA0070896_1001037 [Candidatus Kentron sp. H]VFJ90813.1 MAG: hypothetical protein BECKH772B_GA0070898_1001137 [Candidatus Kentron sp. H]VFJ96931.1 MAG: hypothetical protein BECKH772C_GA0070978_1000937 [Candidatus Kentron sp. H]